MTVINKHKEDKFFVPLSIPHKAEIPQLLDKYKIKYKIGNLYKTISADLSDLADVYYDILVFYSPSGPKSLLENFPDFVQNNTLIATFGPTTAAAVKKLGLRLDIDAPNPESPSMTMALDSYIRECRKGK
jgi:uroporphyrinogen-III synthase